MTTIYYAFVALFIAAWPLIGARITWWLIAMREDAAAVRNIVKDQQND